MTTLNATFESKLTLEDEGYESDSENFNIPTPLRRTSRIPIFLVMRTLPLIQQHHTAQVPANHITNLYDIN